MVIQINLQEATVELELLVIAKDKNNFNEVHICINNRRKGANIYPVFKHLLDDLLYKRSARKT